MCEYEYWMGYTNIQHKDQYGKRNLVKFWNYWCYCSSLTGQKGRYERKTLSQSALMLIVGWWWLWNICTFLLECARFIAWFQKTNEQSYGCQMINKRWEKFLGWTWENCKKAAGEKEKEHSFHMNVKWINTQRSYCSAVAFPSLTSCFLSALFSLSSEHSTRNDFSFTQLLRLVETPVQLLILPRCSYWVIPHKWALLNLK